MTTCTCQRPAHMHAAHALFEKERERVKTLRARAHLHFCARAADPNMNPPQPRAASQRAA